jgi:hypothetical protein
VCSKDSTGYSFNYAIDDSWNQNKNNNIIQCTVSINGTEFILSETLQFGLKGTSGTAYTFILEMLDGKNAISVDKDDKTLRI